MTNYGLSNDSAKKRVGPQQIVYSSVHKVLLGSSCSTNVKTSF